MDEVPRWLDPLKLTVLLKPKHEFCARLEPLQPPVVVMVQGDPAAIWIGRDRMG